MNKIKICPSCKKFGLEMYAGGETGTYKCRCGYVGPIFLEVRDRKKKNRD